jgi:CDP-4-dehydro-6-deoxyglucose reductase, E3
VLAAALRNGVGLPYGCKNGACGTCRSKLLEGTLVHKPHSSTALSDADEAKGYALVCSAIGRSPISSSRRAS